MFFYCFSLLKTLFFLFARIAIFARLDKQH